MLKIAVYSCALNEEPFAKRWAASCEGADQRFVLDTGSTDKTVDILTGLGVGVDFAHIKPWRFDMARNTSLSLLRDDIDVAIQLDLDEILVENWREKVESAWAEGTNRLHYRYVWSHTVEGNPDQVFYSDKISGRHSHIWRNPVHEVLKPVVPEVVAKCDDILIEHYPDNSKDRSGYLALLELSVAEDAYNDRNQHYLGREYYFRGRYEDSIRVLLRHLSMPTAVWHCERSASMRLIAKCFVALNRSEDAHSWFLNATTADPQSREALVDLAGFLLSHKEWLGCAYFCKRAMAIPPNASSYINERYALNEGPHDLASVALWNLGQIEVARQAAMIAVQLNPHDPRLQNNVQLIENAMKGATTTAPKQRRKLVIKEPVS